MRASKLFTKTSKSSVAETESANARLLVQGQFVDQLMAGVYSYLPLGLRVLRKIEQIVREEMNALEANEVLMATLHPKAIWEKTGAWDNVDVLFKIQSRTGNEYALGQSEEEVVTPLVLSRAQSYKQLPLAVYEIHWKYRDELRAKSGIMRGREFFMKDMYSFHTSQEDFDRFYALAKDAYLRIFSRLGLVAKVTEASGGNFSEKISYEFEVLTDAGEDVIYYCDSCDFCVEDEIAKQKPGDTCPRCAKDTLKEAKSAEVGNVFDLGRKYGKDFDLAYTDEQGERQYPVMGCYGIGISRVMGVIVEKYHDDKGITWPKSVAPFHVHLVSLAGKNVESRVIDEALKLYDAFMKAGVEVFLDDRNDTSAGEKFADADLFGMPLRIVISEKTLMENAVEWKERTSDDASRVPITDVVNKVKDWVKV